MEEYRAKAAYQQSEEADSYDDVRFKSLKGRMEDWLERRATLRALRSVPAGARVLDIPCGTGRITGWLLDAGYTVVGADISEAMMAHARRKLEGHPGLEGFQWVDAEAMPFADGEFDAVTSIRFSNHVPRDVRGRVLREMSRVSRGPVIISYCNPNTLSGYKRRLKVLLRKPHAPWNPASPQQVAREAAEAKLKVASAHSIAGCVSETVVFHLVRREGTKQ